MAEFITFFGGDSGVGTTLLSAAFASKMAEEGLRVLFLLASQEAGEGWFPHGGEGFGSLLRTEELSESDLQAAVSGAAGGFPFDYIAEAKDLLGRQFYRPELIRQIRERADKRYDLIVADAGSDATLPLPAACIAWADRRCYVAGGNAKSLIRFEAVFRSIVRGLAPEPEKDLLVLNRAGESPLHAGLSSLTETFGLRGFSMPYSPEGPSWELNPKEAFRKEPQASVLLELARALEPKAGA